MIGFGDKDLMDFIKDGSALFVYSDGNAIVRKEDTFEDKINRRLAELGLEDYSWDISELDDEVIQEILKEHESNK